MKKPPKVDPTECADEAAEWPSDGTDRPYDRLHAVMTKEIRREIIEEEKEALFNPDIINHPPHYTHGGIEEVEVVEA